MGIWWATGKAGDQRGPSVWAVDEDSAGGGCGVEASGTVAEVVEDCETVGGSGLGFCMSLKIETTDSWLILCFPSKNSPDNRKKEMDAGGRERSGSWELANREATGEKTWTKEAAGKVWDLRGRPTISWIFPFLLWNILRREISARRQRCFSFLWDTQPYPKVWIQLDHLYLALLWWSLDGCYPQCLGHQKIC